MTEQKSSENINSLLELHEVLDAVDGKLLDESFDPKDFCFTSVQTDSRKVAEKSLFVPLIGEFQDGHIYVPQAVEAGASVIFISKKIEAQKLVDLKTLSIKNRKVALILVDDTLHALQKAAGAYVRKFPGLIRCSVTGSSGKTTTKEIAASVLRQKFNVIANVGNFNSETGLPLSVFNIRKEHELGLFEMGMNRENEIGEIADTFRPNYGIITNVGTAHIGILGSRQKIAEEKKKIFNFVDSEGACIIPAADDFADFLASGVKGKIIRYGEKIPSAESGVSFISDDGLEGTTFSVDGVQMTLHLPGKYNYINALGAIALARELGLSPLQIKNGIESLKPLGGRSTIRKGRYTILEDCYNANPDSMEKALEFAGEIHLKEKKLFVLGDMLELGEKSEEEHKRTGIQAVKSDAALVVFFGFEMKHAYEAAKEIKESDPENSCRYPELVLVEEKNEEAIKTAYKHILKFSAGGDFVLLKGSRGMGLERIIPLLEEGAAN